MRNNNTERDYTGTMRFIFCILFVITGVWFPGAFMWVVWAFVGYLALLIILRMFIAVIGVTALKRISELG